MVWPQGSILGPLLFLLYTNVMPQAVDSELLLCSNHSCLVFQHEDRETMEEQLNRKFSTFID